MTISLPSGQMLRWLDVSGSASLTAGELSMRAEANTDWFTDPATLERTSNAPVLVSAADDDFQLVALVNVDFAAMFDAGVLFVHQSDEVFAKLCFELSPAGERTVVSVVTRSASDDANGPVIDADQVWLRVSKIGPAFAFHWSLDGQQWEMLRYFRLPDPAVTSVGFCAQSPTGDGCSVRFSEMSWTSTALANVRDGS
jgi:regulation of enolase protein 1 (concanavalin A-like superfamily)